MPDLSRLLEARAALDRHLSQSASRSKASLSAKRTRRVRKGRAWSVADSLEVLLWCIALAAVIGFAVHRLNLSLFAVPSFHSASDPTAPGEITPAIIRKIDERVRPEVDHKADNIVPPAVDPVKDARSALASRLRLAAAGGIYGTVFAEWQAVTDTSLASVQLPPGRRKHEDEPVAATTQPDPDETGSIELRNF